MTSSKREELEALIERLEKATGPDRELDAAIAVACLPQRQDAERANHARLPILTENTPGYYEWVEISGVSRRSAPKYSESIDAAMTLVKEYDLRIKRGYKGPYCCVELYIGNKRAFSNGQLVVLVERADNELATAIVAAALRALTGGENEQG